MPRPNDKFKKIAEKILGEPFKPSKRKKQRESNLYRAGLYFKKASDER